MASIVQYLHKQQKLNSPPTFLKDNTHYEVMMGSVAYGVSNDVSDTDIYGWAIPYKESIFPHLSGYIEGFGQRPDKFEQYQQHHIYDEGKKRNYDLTIYGIVKYFQLCMENNPNMIDSLFVPTRCILHITEIGQRIRDKRKLFLHKGSLSKLKGYAYSQLSKMDVKRQNVPEVHNLWDIEKQWNIPRETSFQEVEEEFLRRFA